MAHRITVFLAAAALLCAYAAAQSQYVEVAIKWDNNIKQTTSNEKAIMEEIAKELCKVPKANVQAVSKVDKSTALNTESWGTYACRGANAQEVTKAAQNCGDKKKQKEFKDELGDRTHPDMDPKSIVCTVKTGTPPKAAGRRMAA